MLKALWNKIRQYFSQPSSSHVNVREHIIDRHRKIVVKIRNATNLAELLDARAQIREFQIYLVDSKLEYWGREMIVDLTKYWKVKYTYWKTKMRGL